MTRQDIISAYRDFSTAFGQVYLWGRMGWAEMRGKYRRTSLGPLWSTISLALFIFVIGQVWSRLWGVKTETFMPYVTAGMVSWVLISSLINDGTNCFLKYRTLVYSIKFPLPLIPFAVTWHHFTLFFHNIMVVVLAGIFYQITLSYSTLLVVPGIILIWMNAVWATTLLGILGARFRDIQIIISSLLQMMIFVTPVFWTYEQLEGRANIVFVKFNPFLHYIEILRKPMLGATPDLHSYAIVIAITILGWMVAFIFYARYKNRITYWL